MKRIRSKLLLAFLILVLLGNVAAFFVYWSSSKITSEYSKSFRSFLLLNDISTEAKTMYEKVNAYAIEKDRQFAKEYGESKQKMTSYDQMLLKDAGLHAAIPSIEKYQYMMRTLMNESDATMTHVKEGKIKEYAASVKEVRTVSSYIQEQTMTLLDDELSEYQVLYQSLQKRHHTYALFTLCLFTLSIGIALWMAYMIAGGISRPIVHLSRSAKEVSEGHFDGPNLHVTSKDEISVLNDAFQRMRQEMKVMIEEMKQKAALDQKIKDMKLKTLQNQMNPHFLFNTLNIVSRMAYLESADATSKLIQSVSTLMRYSLSPLSTSVTLEQEVKVVKEYFHIQETRFADRITCKTTIDESCLSVHIPSLTLQPLVENAFIHGVEPKEENGLVKLSIYRDKGFVMIRIQDNGLGISDREKKRLLSQEEDDSNTLSKGHSTGIGLRNVISRLRLFYGVQDALQIDSKPNEGTTIQLAIPIKEERAC
ncbi:two-component sensor histidine kinase [Bacillus xiamenensis]|uniref:histidine kinase n=1 Tax=Bacillus xiamenensis TaxID=1178537 RepID=A0AAC9NBY3_9BACI|nr:MULTISPECIES: sensor histidine kinase [Bacillus]AOZ89107.1 two-component sensor histidine kinase [Bacillus xiamenensis]EKF35915.1 sensor histidine kinase [Bacillus xiamenensis]MCW1835052.1 sensor histidine kinase [Bacillus xiamenensis]QGX64542.1 HAMP domain-containing protein [Bacillus sp. ms-22]